MAKSLEERVKKHFVIALPEELPIDEKVPGYEDIEKISGSVAGSPQSAVSHYLHRIHPEKARLIVDILNRKMGGDENYAFEVPEVVVEKGKLSWQDKEEMTEYALAHNLADFYNSDPFDYLLKAREVLKGFKKFRYKQA